MAVPTPPHPPSVRPPRRNTERKIALIKQDLHALLVPKLFECSVYHLAWLLTISAPPTRAFLHEVGTILLGDSLVYIFRVNVGHDVVGRGLVVLRRTILLCNGSGLVRTTL
jgi:hypothetical protein